MAARRLKDDLLCSALLDDTAATEEETRTAETVRANHPWLGLSEPGQGHHPILPLDVSLVPHGQSVRQWACVRAGIAIGGVHPRFFFRRLATTTAIPCTTVQASTNKCLAQSNKSCTGVPATNKRNFRPPADRCDPHGQGRGGLSAVYISSPSRRWRVTPAFRGNYSPLWVWLVSFVVVRSR